jgi:hypothetical protein
MDFNLPESKPEVMRPINRDLVDKNKQDLLNFFNVSPKAKVAMAVSGLGILLFFVSISTLSFQNATLNNLFPKDQSKANFQGQLPVHNPIEGPGFLLVMNQQQQLSKTFDLEVQVQTATETASVMTAQIKFDPAMLELVSTDDQNSVATTWIDNTSNNSEGVISLVSSFPRGIQLETAQKYVTITFKPKGAGQTTISVDQTNSKIFRLSDKKEITMQYDSIPIVIKP